MLIHGQLGHDPFIRSVSDDARPSSVFLTFTCMQGVYSALLFLPPGATLALVVPPGHIASATQAINIARVLGLHAATSLPEAVERRHLGVTHSNAYWEAGNEEAAFTPDEAARLLGRAAAQQGGARRLVAS